jgi:hypothetical protein
LVSTKLRTGCDWVWQTTSGSPQAKTAAAVSEEVHKIEPAPKQQKKQPNKKCSDCDKDATHKIEGYKPIYLCEEHARTAEGDGFVPLPLEETNA